MTKNINNQQASQPELAQMQTWNKKMHRIFNYSNANWRKTMRYSECTERWKRFICSFFWILFLLSLSLSHQFFSPFCSLYLLLSPSHHKLLHLTHFACSFHGQKEKTIQKNGDLNTFQSHLLLANVTIELRERKKEKKMTRDSIRWKADSRPKRWWNYKQGASWMRKPWLELATCCGGHFSCILHKIW